MVAIAAPKAAYRLINIQLNTTLTATALNDNNSIFLFSLWYSIHEKKNQVIAQNN